MFASKDLFFSKPSGYQISRSVRFRSSASAYFNRTPASAGNRQTWTWSGWVKRGGLASATAYTLFEAGTDSSNWDYIRFTSDSLQILSSVAGSANLQLVTTQVFRDPSAWYHIVLAYDTTNATSSNRVKLYVNGSQVTAFSTATYPSQNYNSWIDTANAHRIGADVVATPGGLFDGYMTEVNFIDGQALTPSSFGQTNTVTGVWQPLKYTGAYGTNGFYLNFSDNSNNTAATIGKDYSGNGNNWTPNNISVTAGATYDSMLDVPTLYADGGNGRGNYATLNPLNVALASTAGAMFDANLRVTSSGATNGNGIERESTIAVDSTDIYSEFTILATSGTSYSGIAVRRQGSTQIVGLNFAASTNSATITNESGTQQSGLGFVAANDILSISVSSSGLVTFRKNNSTLGTSQQLNGSGLFTLTCTAVTGGAGANLGSIAANFGQRPFTYTPPTGFVALNTQNLPTPTISNGANYMAATLWTGNGTSQIISNSVNGISFAPDFVWIKDRSGASANRLQDTIRGAGNRLASDLTTAEVADASSVTSFNSNGFSIGTNVNYNANTEAFVGWQWKAGGTSSSNTSGSITSTVSVGATQGFSVVTYTGTGSNATVGHGLGVAPKMVIVKSRSASGLNWPVYSSVLGATQFLVLDLTNAAGTASTSWNNTAPTSSVFSVGTSAGTNGSGTTYVAYCFAEVAGYSKFGSYTGNGSANGPFVYCGFRPRFVMVKRTDTTSNWIIKDTGRSTYNTALETLYPNLSNAEGSGDDMDILSNGFKMKLAASTNLNASGGTYIFMAIAENPFKLSLAR